MALKVDIRAYGAVGDGVRDDSAAIQAAIDAVNAAGGGLVRVPVTGAHYNVETPLTVYSDVWFVGEGYDVVTASGSVIKASANGLFAATGTVARLAFYDVYLGATGGDVFNMVRVNSTVFDHVYFMQGSVNQSVFVASEDYEVMRLHNCYVRAQANATVPAFDLVTSGSENTAINVNVFRDSVFYGGAPAIRIASNLASSHSIQNVFERLVFEVCAYGCIHATAQQRSVIRDCGSYDVSAYHDTLYKFVDDAEGHHSANCTIENTLRSAGTLDAGVYDFDVTGSTNMRLENCLAYNVAAAATVVREVDAVGLSVERMAGYTAVTYG